MTLHIDIGRQHLRRIDQKNIYPVMNGQCRSIVGIAVLLRRTFPGLSKRNGKVFFAKFFVTNRSSCDKPHQLLLLYDQFHCFI